MFGQTAAATSQAFAVSLAVLAASQVLPAGQHGLAGAGLAAEHTAARTAAAWRQGAVRAAAAAALK